MSDILERQRQQEEMQKNDAVLDAFSMLVSGGRSGYKSVIEKKPILYFCKSCKNQIGKAQKFCDECGAKNDDPIVKS